MMSPSKSLAAVLLLLANAAHGADSPRVIAQPGWVIFDPTKDGFAYRYGPSIIASPDGKVDAWFASPGGDGPDGQPQWDWIRHRNSKDGGRTWSPETIVLKATPASRDRQSVCDPGAIKLGDWYYLGVTAVEDPKGMCNEVFAARSKSPAGPFEKWNGSGWGGSPMPILPFRSRADAWGLGEPSFVRVGNTLYIYYTENSRNEHGPTSRTLVATAPADADDWPAHLTLKGDAFQRDKDEDSADVKYDDQSHRFVAISTAARMFPGSYINARWSTDGITFGSPTKIEGAVMDRCHNAGLSGTAEGHLLPGDHNFIAYAYSDGSRPGPSWAFWHTYLNPILIQRP